MSLLQRCSRPLCSSQVTGGPTTRSALTDHPPHRRRPAVHGDDGPTRRSKTRSLRTQQCARPNHPAPSRFHSDHGHHKGEPQPVVLTRAQKRLSHSRRSTSEHRQPQNIRLRNRRHGRPPTGDRQLLLRKEVIQPHLPVRLPCYDFVPIADPTFDSSPPHGLGHWLRVLPTFVT